MKRAALIYLICLCGLALSAGPSRQAFAADDDFSDFSSEDGVDAKGDTGDFDDMKDIDNTADKAAEKPIEDDGLEPLSPDTEKQAPVVEAPEAPAPDSLDNFDEPTKELQTEAPPSTTQPDAQPEPQNLVTENRGGSDTPDEPDLNYEAKLHDIFLHFYNSKTPQAEWDALVGSRSAERYRIQKGDNLWNISSTIFGDGKYWPKVWSLNSDIKNPHLISSNNSIHFILGDESEPPAFTVTENATESATSDTGVKLSKTDVKNTATAENTTETTTETKTSKNGEVAEEQEPEIPPPYKVHRPVVKHLPPSLPEWQGAGVRGNYDDAGIDYGRRKILDVEDTVPLTSYISETVPTKSGTISEIEVGHTIASAYQYIYVSMEPGQGQVGDTYLVIANRGEIQSTSPTITGFLGYSVDVQGEVQLVERAQGSHEELTGEVYRALVLRILNPVTVGATLVPGKLEKVKITEEGPRSQVVAQIIGGSYFNRRQVYGNESIAYLNRGDVDGLQPGQVLPIRANRKVREQNTMVESNIRPIGWLRVIKTTPHFATVVVIRAWSDVLSGDLTGTGTMLPSVGVNDMPPVDGNPPVDLENAFESDGPAAKAPADKDSFDVDDTSFTE